MKRQQPPLCSRKTKSFIVKVSNESCPPLWTLQPEYCPRTDIKPAPKVQKEINKALGRPGSDMGEFLVPETRGIVKERENFRRLRERKSELGTK